MWALAIIIVAIIIFIVWKKKITVPYVYTPSQAFGGPVSPYLRDRMHRNKKLTFANPRHENFDTKLMQRYGMVGAGKQNFRSSADSVQNIAYNYSR